jgi:hypothetical protein
VLLVALSACADAQATGITSQPVTPSVNPASQSFVPADLSRSDQQGAVEVVVIPLNLSDPGQTLDFEISLNTHSVDLSMDLASLAALTTDTGKTVNPLVWDAPRGGHHVSGKLSFPIQSNGTSLLEGAKRLTLTIRNVDSPERIFIWELGG